ncbi:uncharacterized protein LOC111664535 [Seriola lalandi dorsalis]|uniref:uncharacterized protein LOC111664535 n=1 Tax=Seriola lalandi dorsalis TaxID=1841481 RepID=UPI000C6F6770|nr:uncharacterized protein LOC111664535 [Seriola lalandi dorsalis]
MESFGRLFFMLTWIFFFPSVCSGMDAPKLSLETRVFVALADEKLTIKCSVTKPANQTEDMMACYDLHHNMIYNCVIEATAGKTTIFPLTLYVGPLNVSGEYYCQYQRLKAYWFLRVRDSGYTEPVMLDYTEFIVLAFLTGVLLVFSVIGSVYVFRGHPKEQITQCGETGGKRKQNKEERKAKETKEDKVDVTTAPSLYASLEPRPRSIYDVLDPSAANGKSDQGKAKAKKNKPHKTMGQTTEHQDEGVFESVYENF